MIGTKTFEYSKQRAKERQGTRTDIVATLPEGEKKRATDEVAEMVDVK